MGEKRTKAVVGTVSTVLIYRKGMPCPEHMRQIPTPERGIGHGEFFFDGRNVHFASEEAGDKKFIVYDSVTQVQRTTKGKQVVKLRP